MASAGRPKAAPAVLPLLVGFGTIFLLLGGFAAWAMNAEIDGAVVAPGRIVQELNRQAIQHPIGGVVEKIYVQEGDTVTENQLLVKLDPTLTRSELTIVEGQLFELMARRGRLEAERIDADAIVFDPVLLEQAERNSGTNLLVEGQIRLFQARRDSIEKEISQLRNQAQQLENQIIGIDAQTAAMERQVDLIAMEVETQESLLKKGLAQKSRLTALQRESARLDGSTGELIARRAQVEERISELAIQELRLFTQRREEAISVLRDLQFSEMEAAERRRTLLTQLDRMDIRAPVAGVLYDLRLFGPRSVVRAADSLMYIVPQDRALLIEAQVDPMNVNEVFVGQDVVLRFSAFDMRDTPDLFGKVKRVSPDAFTNEANGQSYYRAEIMLPKAEIAKLSDDQVLIPGMPAQTFIQTGKHTPMAYLTQPLTKYFSTAMRDDG